jgi:FlaA1/EpsC-like NDP-sugar epimerase
VVVVTGAGGSIGSELCRQIFKFSPKLLVLIDNSESSLYYIYEELKKVYASKIYGAADGQIHISSCLLSVQPKQPIKILARLASVRDRDVLFNIFSECKPDTVFHAAAYKHVPLVEENPIEGIYNNVFGTLTCAEVSAECLVSHFILISTDKAVRPSSVMGASKRIAELILQAKADDWENQGRGTIFSMVRFGNVLGSSGSVAPIFSSQIKSGGPITLTHTEVTRYFMTIPEAAQLVIQASAMAAGGEVFVLEMGPPIKIYDLALRMIRLSGLTLKDRLNPNGDIEIEVIGLRLGEKLHEDLLIGNNPQPTSHPKIMKAHENFVMWCELIKVIQSLEQALQGNDIKLVGESLKNLMPENSLLI